MIIVMVVAPFESVSVEIVVLSVVTPMVAAMVMVTMMVAMPASVVVIMVAYIERCVRLSVIWEV